jgi:hypothetical protein
MGLRDLIRRARPTFKPLERHLLDAVGGRLQHPARELYERQLEAVNKVQRLGGSREVNLYRMRGGRPQNDPRIAFADRRLEVELARVRFRIHGEGVNRLLTLYMVDGFVFSLVFDPPAEPVQQRDDLEVVDIELLVDPMRHREAGGPPPPIDPQRVGGVVARWRERSPVTGTRQPLEPAERQRRLREISAHLPADYLRLTEQTEGVEVGGWRIYGLSESYGISLDDAEYHVLAELEGEGVLAVEKGSADLYFVPFNKGPREPASRFTEAVENRLRVTV